MAKSCRQKENEGCAMALAGILLVCVTFVIVVKVVNQHRAEAEIIRAEQERLNPQPKSWWQRTWQR